MVAAVKCLFGLPYKANRPGDFLEENINYLRNMSYLINSIMIADGYLTKLEILHIRGIASNGYSVGAYVLLLLLTAAELCRFQSQ